MSKSPVTSHKSDGSARAYAPNKLPRKAPAPIKMIALDLDGTLFRHDKSVSPRNIKALQAAHAKGIRIVLASGRMTPAMESAATQLGLDVYIVSYNGAVACSLAADGRKRLFHRPLNRDVTQELFHWAHQRRYQINFYHNDVILSEDGPHLRPFIDIYHSRTGSPFRIVERLEEFLNHSPTKLLFVTEPEIRNAIDAELRPRYESRATVIRTDPEYLEFLDPSVNKGSGLTALAESLGIAMDNVMAVGDGENDVPMLSACGWGVAVGNAVEQCRAAADAMTECDHEHDAVAEAVERWALNA